MTHNLTPVFRQLKRFAVALYKSSVSSVSVLSRGKGLRFLITQCLTMLPSSMRTS